MIRAHARPQVASGQRTIVDNLEAATDSERGKKAADTLWRLGRNAGSIDDPMTSEFALSALAELEQLQHGTPGAMRDVLEGAQMSAEQLNVEYFHGVIEILQNADDFHASHVRVGVRIRSGGGRELVIAHNGDRVRINHVLPMTHAFVSTKREDPRAKGRFGIGLKTLGRLGDTLTVHCEPYHFTIEGSRVRAASPECSIAGFFDGSSSETLFELQLRKGFDLNKFQSWFASLGSTSMLFLDSVRSLELVDLRRRMKRSTLHKLTELNVGTVSLPGITEPCRVSKFDDPQTGRSWDRYEISRGVPNNIRRSYKATGVTMPMAVAIPRQPGDRQQLYAGLPLELSTALPLSLNAQFDVDVARRGIQHEKLNKWLFTQLADLTGAIALDRLVRTPKQAWCTIPLRSEQGVPDDFWIGEQIAEFVRVVQSRVQRGLQVVVDGEKRRLRDLVYEADSLEGLLGHKEVAGLRPRLVLVPKSARDREVRWRKVLGDIAGAALIDVPEALKLLDWEDEDLGLHDVRWFIKLARAAIDANLGSTLWLQRSILTAESRRIVPPQADEEEELLLRSAQPDSFASRLGLVHVIHPSYLTNSPDAVAVCGWLEENQMLRQSPDGESTLRALAARDGSKTPIVLSDEELRLLRDALASVSQSVQHEVGHAIGRVITLDILHWKEGKRVVGQGRPAESYFPASIEDRKDGWSKAAGATPGLSWIHPRYEEVLRRSGRRRAGSGDPRPLAARALLGLIGVEVAPRLVQPDRIETRYGDPASPIEHAELSSTQAAALAGFQRHATHLKDDTLSPDLVAVLRDIQIERGVRARRERARALLLTLAREWQRLYATHVSAKAVWSYGSWHTAGTIPATWLARAMDEIWLTSEDGQKKPPRELALRTHATAAIYGDDPGSFIEEIAENDGLSHVLSALGVQVDPQVSEMIDQLVALRAQGGVVDAKAVSLRYAAIGAACGRRDLSPDDLVGDLTLRKLRARFGVQHAKKPGLIYTEGRWLPPAGVFSGAPIFGQRRPFVSERSSAERLWRALGVVAPSIGDCVDVLEEMAHEASEAPDEQVLVNVYNYIESKLGTSTARERARLGKLPLWTGHAWQTKRPVYVVDDTQISEALSAHLPVWQLPVSAPAVNELITLVGASRLTEAAFNPVVHKTAFVLDATIQSRFETAVGLLREWLSRRDRKLFEALAIPWGELAAARIAVDNDLELELVLDDAIRVQVPARAHVSRSPLTFYFSDLESVGADDAGGEQVASLFMGGDFDKLALVWSNSWDKAGTGAVGAITLVSDAGAEETLADLFQQASGTTGVPRRGKTKQMVAKEVSPSSAAEPLPVRRLKGIEDLQDKSAHLEKGVGTVATRASGRRGLHDELPPGKTIGGSAPAPTRAPLAYSAEEKDLLALQVLQAAINGESEELLDYRHLRGIGADALDKLRRYFEIKASYGALPDEVTLTANEADRAFRERDKYLLAVVAGLEEGYETVVKIFANPLRSLEVKGTTSITLTGVSGQRQALEVRFPAGPASTPLATRAVDDPS